MVLDYLRGYPKSERLLERSKIFNLPPILKEREFGWDCQPPPSWQAISQGQEPDENPREQITASDIVSNVVTEPSAEQLINEMECQLVDPSEQLEEEPRENLGEEQEEASSEQHSQEPSQELSLRNCQQSDENLSLRSRRIRWFGPQSSSSESEPNEFYFLSDEDSEGDDDDENEDSDDGESIVIRPTRCTLRDTSDTDSDEYEFPDRLRVIGGSISQYRECPVQDFGPDSTGEEEYLDLERASLGLQFWSSMVSNPEGGPGKYMHFKAYSRYGFLLWEEWRMIEFGLWSNKPIEDMSVYYQKWFRFLCPEDMALHKKFRYAWDEDWL
ncbi:uncharacterized protein N7498_006149 [Penicillium cinerascens]|uniref:Uncharacterized protein n=1 Tax=Penicillium cinerascens TaxID=70096 RepID=A0A9W9SX72_9EURO|nr:uncharacterized protein N7498_006149 [Penicillium cinerascens]KAJ5201486.1 hypothetical protein N7498_006149 [Penicillium cinerascens]